MNIVALDMRTPRGLIVTLGAVLLLLLAPVLRADVAIPALAARVTDLTGTLDSTQTVALESKLAALEQRKGAQLAILLLPSTQPETIEQFAVRAFEQWKLGRRNVDDGVLLVVAKTDRKVRIEVGYGLEGAIPDVAASRVVSEYLTPHFREGNYYLGIEAATDALSRLIEGEALPPPYHPEVGPEARSRDGSLGIYAGLGVFFSLLFAPLRLIYRMLTVGALVGVVSCVMGATLAGALIAGVIGAFVAAALGAQMLSRGRFGGWSSGGGSSWSSGGFSSGGGGGGFSGGGGSSGGGGASGSW